MALKPIVYALIPLLLWAGRSAAGQSLTDIRSFEVTAVPAKATVGDSIVLTFRLAELGLEPMYGTAVDDAHSYHAMRRTNANPGRGWVMVRSEQLSAAATALLFDQTDRASDVLLVRRQRLGRKHCGVTGEENDVE